METGATGRTIRNGIAILVIGFTIWYVLLGGKDSLYQSAGLATPIANATATSTMAAAPPSQATAIARASAVGTLDPFCSRVPTGDRFLEDLFDVMCVPPDARPARTYVVEVPNWTRGAIDERIGQTALADYSGTGRPAAVKSLDLEVQVLPNADRARKAADLTDRRYEFLSAITLPGGISAQLAADFNLANVVISFSRDSVAYAISTHVASGSARTSIERTAMSEYALRFAREYLATTAR